MEEILNGFSNDLDKYTQEFHKQAGQIAKWDEELIENGKKVSCEQLKCVYLAVLANWILGFKTARGSDADGTYTKRSGPEP